MTEKTHAVPNGVIHYWMNDFQPGRAVLVVLPGLTADHRLFDKQVEAFESTYKLLVWDAPGHGKSRPFVMDFTLAQKAAWLHAILQAEGITAPVLVGQSVGGYLSQAYIQAYPGEVRGFVSIDSAPLKRKYMSDKEFWMLNHMAPVYSAMPWKMLRNAAAQGIGITEYAQQNMREMVAQYSRDEFCGLMKHGFIMLAGAIGADLGYDITCPCILLCGEHDKTGATKRYNPMWAAGEHLPLTWVKDAGHNSNADNPAFVNAEIEKFVAGLPGLRTGLQGRLTP